MKLMYVLDITRILYNACVILIYVWRRHQLVCLATTEIKPIRTRYRYSQGTCLAHEYMTACSVRFVEMLSRGRWSGVTFSADLFNM